MTAGKQALALAGLFAVLLLVYSNHFHNGFHFDDSHTILNNPWIRDPRNIPRFFKSADTYSTNLAGRNYRPLLSTSFAVDYQLSHGLNPLWFHISTFFWFTVQLALTVVLFRQLAGNFWIAVAATALYGLHPAMAETVNYVMQRGEIYSTLTVIAGLVIYIGYPNLRRYGLYLIPVVIGLFAKEPGVVFPVLLFLWIWLFDESDAKRAFIRSIPAFAVTGTVALFIMRMYASTFEPGAYSAWNYRISQPAVIASYFRTFFIPLGFSADTDRQPYTSILNPDCLEGFLFIAALALLAVWCGRRKQLRPISFGLAWFLIAPIPTSWVGLAEVENDHRLFFPFAGLSLAVTCAGALAIARYRIPRPIWATAFGIAIAACALGAHERNNVWHTDESLWYDVTVKSPNNGRGLMNYGLTQMAAGRYTIALDYFQRALELTPNYPTLEVNLGIVNGALNRDAEAERHFQHAIELAPRDTVPRFYYAQWLVQRGRLQDALPHLKYATGTNPGYIDADHLLMQVYSSLGDRSDLKSMASKTLGMFPSDAEARNWLAKADFSSPDELLTQSLVDYRGGRFLESIAAAREVLKLKPDSAEAWNNICAGNNSLARWQDAADACRKAIELKPGWQLPVNNLAVSMSHLAPK